MTTAIDRQLELDGLRAVFSEIDALQTAMGARITERALGVSGWSCAEHLYHLALATDLAFRNIRGLVSGKSPLIVHEGEPNELARQVLTEGHYPRGKSEAPRMVRPPDDIELEYLGMELQQCRSGIEDIAALASELRTATGRIPHQDLGPLSAEEWLRFARLHAEHHLAIVIDVERAGG